MFRLVPHTLLAVVAGVFLAQSAQSCQCGAVPVPAAVSRAQYVFLGLVTAIDDVPITIKADDTHTYTGRAPRVTFRVGQRWKGAPTPSLSVVSSSDCAYTFQLGRSYLVFAEPDWFGGTFLIAPKCLPNAPRAMATESIRLLGPPLRP